MNKKIRFGIIGAGGIANKFATGLSVVDEAELVAVASRDINKANQFADTYSVAKRYGSYEELVKDEEIDVVYISTPNALHKEHTILCLNNKKGVICEKPFGANQADVEEMIKVAKDNGVFLMEAMWTRYFPIMETIRKWLDEGVIGKVKMVKGDFGFKCNRGYGDIRFNKELAGGSVMDVGIYPISFASMVYKEQPKEIMAMADIGHTGVDEQAAMMFRYEDDKMALLSSAIMTQIPRDLYIVGDLGHIQIPDVWYAQSAILKLHDEEEVIVNMPMEGNGYNYEVKEVVRCIRQGKLESDLMPLKESLEIMGTVDKVRKQIGLI